MRLRWPGAARREAERQAFLDALQAVVQIAQAHASATESLAQAIVEWARPFKASVEDAPARWVNDDEAEWLREQEQAGTIPPGATQAEQMAAIARALDSGWSI